MHYSSHGCFYLTHSVVSTTKELIICFNKKVNAEDIPSLCINGNNIERVNTFKLLCVSSDLSWDYHVMYLRRKVAKRMYCINYRIYYKPVYLHLTLCVFIPL